MPIDVRFCDLDYQSLLCSILSFLIKQSEAITWIASINPISKRASSRNHRHRYRQHAQHWSLVCETATATVSTVIPNTRLETDVQFISAEQKRHVENRSCVSC